MMSTDNKDDSNSTQSDVKVEEDSSKEDFDKVDESSVDRESKDNAKDGVKKENSEKDKSNEDGNAKKENEKDGSENHGSEGDEESEEEERVGMLDRPVQVSGCRARKQVQRFEVTFNTPTKEILIPEGKGQKLGDIPIIEQQIAKHTIVDLKILHRILYFRAGSASDTKKNIRKFSGFTFQKNSPDFEAKKASLEKLTQKVLKTICDILVLEKNKTKEDITMRILDFLMCPKDSGKKLPPKKRGSSQDKKRRNQKKTKSNQKKAKPNASEEEELIPTASEISDINASETSDINASETSDINASEDNESDSEIKKKSKTKGKKKPSKVKAAAVKVAKPKSEPEKGIKRKKEAASEAENEEEKPPAKKSKIPEDEDIEKLIEKILENADLQEITMKKVIKEVFDTYPDCDLMHKKPFIKETIKLVINR